MSKIFDVDFKKKQLNYSFSECDTRELNALRESLRSAVDSVNKLIKDSYLKANLASEIAKIYGRIREKHHAGQ